MYVEELPEHLMELGARADEANFAKAFLETCVPKLEEAFTDNFARQASATGGAWPPRKDPRPKHPLLILTSALIQSVGTNAKGHVERVGPTTLELGTDLVYAATHQYGDRSRNIAARPFLDVADHVLDSCEAVIADHFEDYLWGSA